LKTRASGSSRPQDQDIEMLDAQYQHSDSDPEEQPSDRDIADPPQDMDTSKPDDEACAHDDGDEDERTEDVDMSRHGGPPVPPMDEATALGIFGDIRQIGSYMMSLSSRLKTMLNNIKPTADPTTRLITLQELSELLSISTEDTLAGSFQVESFVRELVKILGGRGAEEDEDDDEGEGDEDTPQDEDSALAAALAMSTAGMYQGDDNLEAQVLACRCLANLMEALPGVAHTIVYHGAIPVLCSKLIEISYIDLAEQTLSVRVKAIYRSIPPTHPSLDSRKDL
jgi:E3 ubiquitin-protein ligase TRIP12